uniref:C2H2-type domain-containing protein n=1 Tax=Mesocestoides corti TaxID=53468 RepID=A0A5K3EFG9_MESCO
MHLREIALQLADEACSSTQGFPTLDASSNLKAPGQMNVCSSSSLPNLPTESSVSPHASEGSDTKPNLQELLAQNFLQLNGLPSLFLPSKDIQHQSSENTSTLLPNLDMPHPLVPPQLQLPPPPLTNGPHDLNGKIGNPSLIAGASAMLSGCKALGGIPAVDTMMSILATMSGNGESKSPPLPPSLPIPPSLLNAFMKLGEQKDLGMSVTNFLDNGAGGRLPFNPNMTSPTGTSSTPSCCVSPRSGNSDSTTTRHNVPRTSKDSPTKPMEAHISDDGKQCTVCYKRFTCTSALRIHYRKHSGRDA